MSERPFWLPEEATTRHPLSERHGSWVEMRSADDVRSRDRDEITRSMYAGMTVDTETGKIEAPSGEAVAAAGLGIPKRIAALLITAWEIPYLPDAPIPSIEPLTLDYLRADDMDQLEKLIEPARALLMPKSVDPSDHADPQSPFEPGSA
jgi:hypothetical protein